MDTDFYKYKALLKLAEADEPVKRSVLIRAAMHHVPGNESEMLLDFMEETELVTVKVIRNINGAGRPPTYIEITDQGRKALKQLQKERKPWQT